jgi:hypothetical protein
VLVFLAVANSAIANANASANAATRTWFAMGRIRLLPRPLERVHPRWRSPDVAVTTQLVVGVVVAVWLGLGLQYDPLTAFAIVGTIVTAVIIALVSRVVEFPFVNPQTGPFHVEGPSPATPWPSTSCPSSRRGTGPPRPPSRCSGP